MRIRYNQQKYEKYVNPDAEILEDLSSTGRKRPWKEKKESNEYLSKIYERVNVKKSQRLLGCGDLLIFDQFDSGERKLASMNSCHVRLCPICSWRRSLKIFSQVSVLMDALKKNKLRYTVLTVTIRNVVGEDLSEVISKMMKAYQRLIQRQRIRNMSQGWYRSLEITYNKKKDTYHPHFHVIFAVKPSYFRDETYIEQSEYQSLWKESYRIDTYDPQVNIKRVSGNTAKAVAEIAKYTVKESDYLLEDEDMSVEVVRVLDQALHNRRLVAFGGIFKKLHHDLNLDDAVDGDLVHVDVDEEKLTDEEKHQIAFVWSTGLKNYYRFR